MRVVSHLSEIYSEAAMSGVGPRSRNRTGRFDSFLDEIRRSDGDPAANLVLPAAAPPTFSNCSLRAVRREDIAIRSASRPLLTMRELDERSRWRRGVIPFHPSGSGTEKLARRAFADETLQTIC